MATSIPVPQANTAFSLALFKKLSADDNTANIFFSPFSISAALAMVMLGARGNTAVQMSEVLGFTEAEQPEKPAEMQQEMQTQLPMQTSLQSPMQAQIQTLKKMQMQQPRKLPDYLYNMVMKSKSDSTNDVHKSFAKLLSELIKSDAPYALSLANRLYGEKTYEFAGEFLAETKKYYSAELELVDFKTNAEEARVLINNWVEEKTQGKIKDLLTQEVVKDSTKLVLVNAIYFKGQWESQFLEDSTIDGQFRINKNETKPVKMMRQKSDFPMSAIPEAKLKILEMPYEGKTLSMIIFLPDDIEDDTTGLEELEKTLTYEKFVEWTKPEMMVHGKVDVNLPRFRMEEKYDLKEVLISMGMKDAFDVRMSDLSGMSSANDLVVSEVVHKAFVDVNEEGTEAAAATGVVIIERTAVLPALKFTADHPFLFFIRHNPTGCVLFAGRYCSPE